MPETILLVLICAKIKKYNIKPIFKIKELYLVIFAEIFYIGLQTMFFNGDYRLLGYASIFKSIYICSYLGLVYKNSLYKEALIGSGFVVLGGICNDIAMAANNGLMPAFPTLSYLTGYVKADSFEVAQKVANDIHTLGNADTKLKVLTDIFDLGYSVLSIGDIFIRVFVFLILYKTIKILNEQSKIQEII